MKERLCEFQDTMFANNLGLLISRCLRKGCKHFAMSLTEDICLNCEDRILPQTEEPHLQGVLNMEEKTLRSPRDIKRIFNHHCKRCEDRIGEYFCKELHLLPIKELLKLPDIVCPRGLWK